MHDEKTGEQALSTPLLITYHQLSLPKIRQNLIRFVQVKMQLLFQAAYDEISVSYI